MITKRQKQTYDFIKTYSHKHGFAPSLEEIKGHLKLSSVSTAHHHVKKLEEAGLLYKEDNQPRGMTTKSDIKGVEIPVLGTIAAGQPIEAIEVVGDTVVLARKELTLPGRHYALRVSGHSMIEEGIFDGDIVVVHEQKVAENGQTVVAVIDDNQATLKKFYREGSRIRLQPANRLLTPFYRTEVDIRGIVVKIIRELESSKKAPGGILRTLLKNTLPTDHVKRLATSEPNERAKPFIQWVGGKREMIKQYQEFIPKKFNNYFEPFFGGGAMFFHLQPEESFLSDNNTELVRTYEAVRDNPEEVINILKEFRAKHSQHLYTKVRNLDREHNLFTDFDKEEIAARMIYLNQTCFNGVYRVNQKGQFNVPIGSSLNRLICDEHTIRNASRILQKVKITDNDFSIALKEAKKGDLIYLDPPYYPISEYSDFTRYTKEKFYQTDQIRLKEEIDRLNKLGCKVMLSNSDCEFIRELYEDYEIHKVSSGRSLNSKKDRRGKVSELLITNY